jgi:hypothetical protein
MTCLLDKDITISCEDTEIGGVKKFIMLYNFDDWQAMKLAGNVVDVENVKLAISDIINNTGIRAFRFDVYDTTALNPTSAVRSVDGGPDGFDHGLGFSIASTKQDAKNLMSVMRFQNVVAVLMKNNGEGEVYGSDQGMGLSANNYDPSSPDTGSVIPIEVLTRESEPAETQPPRSVFKVDAATTLALIESLDVVGP